MATYGVKAVSNNGNKLMLKEGLTKDEAIKIRNELAENYAKAGIDCFEIKLHIEMNRHEQVIDQLIRHCVSEWIGGFENTLQDYPEDHEEYKNAKAILNHDSLFDAFYTDIMAETKRTAKSHLRFAGKQFIVDRIETALKKNGYGKE